MRRAPHPILGPLHRLGGAGLEAGADLARPGALARALDPALENLALLAAVSLEPLLHPPGGADSLARVLGREGRRPPAPPPARPALPLALATAGAPVTAAPPGAGPASVAAVLARRGAGDPGATPAPGGGPGPPRPGLDPVVRSGPGVGRAVPGAPRGGSPAPPPHSKDRGPARARLERTARRTGDPLAARRPVARPPGTGGARPGGLTACPESPAPFPKRRALVTEPPAGDPLAVRLEQALERLASTGLARPAREAGRRSPRSRNPTPPSGPASGHPDDRMGGGPASPPPATPQAATASGMGTHGVGIPGPPAVAPTRDGAGPGGAAIPLVSGLRRLAALAGVPASPVPDTGDRRGAGETIPRSEPVTAPAPAARPGADSPQDLARAIARVLRREARRAGIDLEGLEP